MMKGSDDKFSPDEFGVEGPAWADGKTINEAIFCEEFLSKHKILFSGGSFFTTEGRVLDMDTITAPLIHELIDHIDVYEAEGKGKNKTQRVMIHYNFVGYLEIPENDEPCFTADTRQGVAIGYIAKPTEKSA